MSLTTILSYGTKEYKGFRAFLCESFPKPRLKENYPLQTPLISTSPSLIGTAFDYLLRFNLEKKYRSKVISTGWVSEHAINGYFKSIGLSFQSFGYEEELTSRSIKQLMSIKKKVPQKFKWCKTVHAKFLRSELRDSSQLTEVCLFLARLDNIYRRGLPTVDELKALFDTNKHDIEELRSLTRCCNLDRFKADSHIILNPGFGTDIVSADADLVVDEMLIDVKVTKHLKLTREHFNQLIGYYLLYLIGGFRIKKKVKISKIAIYFARHDFLWTVDIEQIGSEQLFRKAANNLKQSLKKHPL
jgi:hypothetical protein